MLSRRYVNYVNIGIRNLVVVAYERVTTKCLDMDTFIDVLLRQPRLIAISFYYRYISTSIWLSIL